jgi:general secretion pathway protein M
LVLSSRAGAKREDKDAADQIEVNASLEGTNDALQDTLFRLESGTPLILVDGLTIRPAEDGSAVAASQPRLHAELIIRGYWGGRK